MKIQIPQIPKYGSHCPLGTNFISFLNFSVIIFLHIGLLASNQLLNPPTQCQIPKVDRLYRSGELAHVGLGGPPRYTGFL